MPSASHSGRIRSSHSPSVIALSSAKAPSTATAKPRFRTRTGCWTCRKRKVKCDERGRNPETVAYGGMLSSSSGCKRCEDSGRPCHGYGAQPPSGPLITHYPPSNLNLDTTLGGRTSFYSFSAHQQDSVNIPATFPVVMGNVEPDPRYIPHSMQWPQPFEQSLPHNQAMNYSVRMLRNTPSCSSPASTSLGASSTVPINQTSIPLSSVDLRRFSVPNYPTWQRSPQLRNTGGSYSSGSMPGNTFSIDQASSNYDNLEGEALPPSSVTSAYERPDSILQIGECNALSTDGYQNITQNDISPLYNHDMSESDTQSLSFDFTRPHTSSGITLAYDDSQSHQNLPKVYGSPIHAHSKELECIDESSGVTSTSLPTCTDASMQAWPEHHVPITTYRRLSSVLSNHPLNTVQTPLFPTHAPQVNDSMKCQSAESFKKTSATDIPLFPSIRDMPYVHPPQQTTTSSAVCQADAALSVDRCCGDSIHQATTERPLHLFQMDPGCHKTFAEMMTHDPHDTLRLNACSYMRSCGLPSDPEGKIDQSPARKESSSSLSSSHSAQDYNLSPTTQHLSIQHPCSTSSSLASPIATNNHFYRPCVLPQGISRRNPSLTTVDLCSQPSHHPARWAPHGLIPSLENPQYDFKPILDQKGTEFHGIDVHEDDSPTSTAPSNTSVAPGAT